MPSIRRKKLESLLFGVSQSTFVSLTTVTQPDMLKRGNPFAEVARKVTIVVGVIAWQYGRTVNRQRERESRPTDFQAMPRQWGQRIKNTPLVSHVVGEEGETRIYLEVKIESRTAHYFDRETNQRIPEDQLQPFLRPDSPTRQNLDREVTLRDYRLDHIAELTLNGTRYTIAPAVSELRKYFPPQSTAGAAKPKRPRRSVQSRKPVPGAT